MLALTLKTSAFSNKDLRPLLPRGAIVQESLPLDGAGGFAGDVVGYAVDASDFVDDAGGAAG